ncbi:MAG: cyclic nucleotide-binding domain-containing protein [Zetaproteobacteria bacterium]|nr:cyclic nucleotide-binding domain-containing protein [Zetaproteobacteria bacterium]
MNHSALNHAMNAVYASNQLLEIFQSLAITKNMPKAASARLYHHFSFQHHIKGKVIYRAGEVSEQRIHLILNGTVALSDGSGNIFKHLHCGDHFGLFSFLDHERKHAVTVTVEKDADILTLDRTFLDTVYLQNPDQGNQLLRFMFNLLSQKTLNMESEYAAIHQFALGKQHK